MRKCLPLFFLFVITGSKAQLSRPLQELRSFIKKDPPKITPDSSNYLDLFEKNQLNYFYPLYKAFVQEEKSMVKDSSLHYSLLADAVSFLGDNSSVLTYEKASYETLPDSIQNEISRLAGSAAETTYMDARKYIAEQSKNKKMVMLNEAHNKPQTHGFAAGVLEDLYKEGFRYLGMEMLDNRKNKAAIKINALSGFYVNEPVAAELIRKAIEIGYTVFPYEDTSKTHNLNQREYAAADNIHRFLATKDSSAKTLVIAGYSHIREAAVSDDHIPMAAYYKIITGTDPLTIDQTEMIEGSSSAYGSLMYEQWIKEKPVNTDVVAVKDNKAVDPFNFYLYDIHVIHPKTKYQNGRPLWITMNGWKQETQVIPAYRTSFLVQAYYEKEYNESSVNQAIPADQTYQTAQNGIYYLYLHKGKYKIVFRDKGYAILGTRDLEVK